MAKALGATALLASWALIAPASAHPPPDLESFVGARAGQAELGVARLGYIDKNRNHWWHPTNGICVKFTVSQGRYKAIDIVQPSRCGVVLRPAGTPSSVGGRSRAASPHLPVDR
jgi:hypothetical protein